MDMTPNMKLNLELELKAGGWSLERQRDIMDWIIGRPQQHHNEESYRLHVDAQRSFKERVEQQQSPR